MPVYRVKVKWGKENYPNVELDTDETPVLFKAQLFALTGVQPERQKVMVKGKIVNEDSWNGLPVKDGAQLLLVGAADELPTAPSEKTAFVEDMSENELSRALDLPAGLSNLGNTCYLNAVIQCLRTVPELKTALQDYCGSLTLSESEAEHNLTIAIRDVMRMMDQEAVVTPVVLVQVLHLMYPRFAERSEQGGFMQQDANECWTQLLNAMKIKLPARPNSTHSPSSLIDQFFGIQYRVSFKNTECETEAQSHSTEDWLQMSCFISQDVKYLQSGLRSRLLETITKNSPELHRDAVYNKSSKISRLPAYLSIQFVRFQYKERASTNAKILKDIKFPMSLDVFELCTPELQTKLLPIRAKFKELDDLAVEQAGKVATASLQSKSESKGDEKVAKIQHPFWFPDDVGSNNSGFYQLQAVLTHKGRSSSSGHYLSWIKRKENEWFKCDDEEVSLVSEEEILKLSGGGDWHTAYVLLYGPRILETTSLDSE